MSPDSAATAAGAAARDPVELRFAAAVRVMTPGDAPAAQPPAAQPPGQPAPGQAAPATPGRGRLSVVGPAAALPRLSPQRCLELFDAQLASRHLDLAARHLRASGDGFYTIGSSGHEGNAGVAAALRLTDPALLHYRSGAFYLVRAAQADPPRDGVTDVLLGL
ncbi:MAG TPA: hypothetical protein VII59_17130, partial [Streptosporangiaceae bacterium]